MFDWPKMIFSKVRSFVLENGGWLRGIPHLIVTLMKHLIRLGPRRFFEDLLWRVDGHRQDERSKQLMAALQMSYGGQIKLPSSAPSPAHQSQIDIIICVHNAPEDVRRCLASVIEFTSQPHQVILIDDGSMSETADILKDFAHLHNSLLFRNETAKGYTIAANQGLDASQGEYVILLNSDTVVTQGWIDRMVSCALSNQRIGLVGPLSNTASWQSIPEIEHKGDWASNPLPEGISIKEMGEWVATFSVRLYPLMPFLNGFCLMIKRETLKEVGHFDADSFPNGYGEENDYCLRARAAGWSLALADDTYIYHSQSKSYSNERRKVLGDEASLKLLRMYGSAAVDAGVRYCREDRVLQGLRARAKYLVERQLVITRGRNSWAGKKILFVLPSQNAGGGANVVLSEARAMIRMGVDVCIANLESHKSGFEQSYQGSQVPVCYLRSFNQLTELAEKFDSVIATAHHTVEVLTSLRGKNIVLGYYIQDFEPYFYSLEDTNHHMALESYAKIPEIIRFTKTLWNHDEVFTATGISSCIVGSSYEVDLFLPRGRSIVNSGTPNAPLRIGAMIRPSSPRRGAEITMQVFKEIKQEFSDSVEILLFGTESRAPGFSSLPIDFDWQNFGHISPESTATFLNELDIFVDFSTYQAMGLTAMEAMACGCAVIVPKSGGASSFALDEYNALVVDTSSQIACKDAVARLVIDQRLRRQLQSNAISHMPQFFPELPALKTLDALFSQNVTSQVS